jgi:signal transduction histidine kinase
VLFGTGALADQSAGLTWLTWWLGDVTGMLVVAPLLLGWVRPGEVRWTPDRAIEIGALGALLLGVTFVVFGGWVHDGAPLPITFLILPFVIWTAVRFSVREVTTLTVTVGVAAVSLTVTGHGPFVAADPQQALLLLQGFIGTIAVTGLVLTVLVHERIRVAESLRKTQHDLEQFVYVAAHDLQEPVRAVINFSELLQTRHRSNLNAEGGEFLEIVVSAGAKMHRRIEDLLEYSRVSHGRLQLVPTESGRALSTALRSLDETIRASGATVTRDVMPRVVADELMISHVFENLVGNALKYRGEQPARVHISARAEGAYWRFHVRDHGIGIDAKHSERIFEMYHRLNAREKTPGSGLGLSICRRIIERHDGRIWLESGQAGHTVFAFTIPAAGGNENAGA